MRQPAAPRAKKKHVKSTGWHSVWEEDEAPSDDEDAVRSGAASVEEIWTRYMRSSGWDWMDHTTNVDEYGNLDQRVQPAADLQRIGNVVRLNATQHNCYLVRSMIDLDQVETRLREHIWVLKNTLTKNSNKLINTKPKDHEGIHNFEFRTLDNNKLQLGLTRHGHGLNANPADTDYAQFQN